MTDAPTSAASSALRVRHLGRLLVCADPSTDSDSGTEIVRMASAFMYALARETHSSAAGAAASSTSAHAADETAPHGTIEVMGSRFSYHITHDSDGAPLLVLETHQCNRSAAVIEELNQINATLRQLREACGRSEAEFKALAENPGNRCVLQLWPRWLASH
jgi:hypothetical protein